MAQYIFVKTRQVVQAIDKLQELEHICELLTPTAIKESSQNTVALWPKDQTAFYAIQNSESVAKPTTDGLLIGWLQQASNDELSGEQTDSYNSKADGAYAVIKNYADEVVFFSDQFGSRTLWYYYNEETLIVSTSQRSIVALKAKFTLNEEVLAWYLSAGCQGMYLSWDQDIKQVQPHLEYRFDSHNWQLNLQPKQGMDLPRSGSTTMSTYLDIYQSQIKKGVKKIVDGYPDGQVLLPLSGGLDSRTLLALTKDAGLDKAVTLVNWGAPKAQGIFDDKVAAHRVAKFYDKKIIEVQLPANIDAYDQVLDRYAEEGEGRLDQINAFTNGFDAWENLFLEGYRSVLRGDVDVTEGLYLNEIEVRANIGSIPFSDYADLDKWPLEKFAKLQSHYDIEPLPSESLIRKRDRLFVQWCIAMHVSPYTDQISGYIENRPPMMQWSLFKLYMGLPDKDKGNKTHIYKTWKKYDKSGVSRYAVGSLANLHEIFDNKAGNRYLLDKLNTSNKQALFTTELLTYLKQKLNEKNYDTPASKYQSALTKIKPISTAVYAVLNDNIPLLLKGYLKSRRLQNLQATTVAYRLVMAEKIITLYESDAQYLKAGN